MEILRYNDQDGRITFAFPELEAVKEFRALKRRDRGGVIKGDPDGRLKYRYYAELGVMWWCNEVNSPGIRKGLNDRELLEDARRNFSLPDTWKPDEEFKAAEAWYIDHRPSVGKELYTELIRTLSSARKYVTLQREKIEKLLLADKIEPIDMATVGKAVQQLMVIAADLPKRLSSLKDAESIIDSEAKEKGKMLRGGGDEEVVESMKGNDY